jgi:uncharacterized membrane protein YdjX (TVP38/TMEM64 family)
MDTALLQNSGPCGGGSGRRHHLRAVVLIVLVIALATTAWAFARERSLDGVYIALLAWIQARGPEAVFWLIGLQALQVVLALPGPFFTLAAGFLFGKTAGTLIAVSGSTTGAVIAYGLARIARKASPPKPGSDDATASRKSSPRLRALGRFVMHGGWRVVLSSRLIPFFPFKLSNYFFGWTRFRFSAFFWGTLLGIIPVTLVSVSMGALASDLASLAHPDISSDGRWMGSLAALAAAAIVLAWAGWRTRAEFRRSGGADGKPG